jgi:hypothetical protein
LINTAKTTGAWDAEQNRLAVEEASAAMAGLIPGATAIDLSGHVARLIALAQSDRSVIARAGAMEALGRWGFTEAVKPATVLLAEAGTPSQLRVASAHAIGRIIARGTSIDDETFGVLLSALETGSEELRAAAADALATSNLSSAQRARLPR